jgi:hypothetical protein
LNKEPRQDAHFENEVLLADSFLQRNKLVKIMILKTYGFLQATKTAETREKTTSNKARN